MYLWLSLFKSESTKWDSEKYFSSPSLTSLFEERLCVARSGRRLATNQKEVKPRAWKRSLHQFFLSLTQLWWMVILLPGLTGWGWILLFPGARTPDQRPLGSFQETFSPARAFLDVKSHQAFLGGWKCQCQPHSVDLPTKHPLIQHISIATLINPGWRISKSL